MKLKFILITFFTLSSVLANAQFWQRIVDWAADDPCTGLFGGIVKRQILDTDPQNLACHGQFNPSGGTVSSDLSYSLFNERDGGGLNAQITRLRNDILQDVNPTDHQQKLYTLYKSIYSSAFASLPVAGSITSSSTTNGGGEKAAVAARSVIVKNAAFVLLLRIVPNPQDPAKYIRYADVDAADLPQVNADLFLLKLKIINELTGLDDRWMKKDQFNEFRDIKYKDQC